MKNDKDQKEERSHKSRTPPNKGQKTNQGFMEGGDGANKNDDRSEDSKGGGNHGLGNQQGANQGNHQGGRGKR